MAVSNSSSSTKTEVYESLYLICQATQQITNQLERLRSAKVLSRVLVEINKEAALQLRAEVTTAAVHNLTAPEIADAHRHERKRIRMERKLAQAGPKVKSSQKSREHHGGTEIRRKTKQEKR